MPTDEDVSGQKYGRLTALRPDPRATRHKRWIFLCDCGNFASIVLASAKKGASRSCGCLRAERNRERSLVHGHCVGYKTTPTRRAYAEMKGRCFNVVDPDYSKYGALGVSVCTRWLNNFSEFLADMGERPTGTVLKRIDVNGDFEPGNCAWRLRKKPTEFDDVQVDFNGARIDLTVLAEQEDVNVARLWTRLKYLGESPEDAIVKMRNGLPLDQKSTDRVGKPHISIGNDQSLLRRNKNVDC